MDYETTLMTEEIQRENGENCRLTEEVPVFTDGKSAARLNRYYEDAHKSLVKRLSSSHRRFPDEIKVKTAVTHCESETVSLYRDFTAGGVRLRTADNWRAGAPLTLSRLGITRRAAIAACTEQASSLDRSGWAPLYPDYVKRIKTAFRKDDFYLKDGKAVIFFQSGAIGAERLGILSFSISLSQTCSPSETADA